jgi:hypothetical protein
MWLTVPTWVEGSSWAMYLLKGAEKMMLLGSMIRQFALYCCFEQMKASIYSLEYFWPLVSSITIYKKVACE